MILVRTGRAHARQAVMLVPGADIIKDQDAEQRQAARPGNAVLAIDRHQRGGEQRPDGRPRVAADLKQRLRQAMPAAGRHARDPAGFGMEHRRPDADQHHRDQDDRIASGDAQKQKAEQGGDHAGRQRIGPGPEVGNIAHRRLQQRGRDLVDQGDDADLGEAQMKIRFQVRIDRRYQRLHHVVQQMAEADREQHREGGVVGGLAGDGGIGHGGGKMPWDGRFGHPLKRKAAARDGGTGRIIRDRAEEVSKAPRLCRGACRQHHQPVETQRHP